MKFCVCIDKVFFMSNFVSAMKITKNAGVSAYEYWKWWEKDVEALLQAQKELDMTCVNFCTKFVSLLDPACRDEYKKGLAETLEMAKRFGVKLIISQVGYELDAVPREQQFQSIVDGLKECAPMLEEAGVTLIVEPLNHQDHPGYFLTGSEESFRLIDEVGSENVKILYDIYHFQITEGNIIHTIEQNIKKIGHFHAAGNPGRNGITRGEINYLEVFRAIRAMGYEDYVGLECVIPMPEREKGIREALELFNRSME